VCKSSCKRDSNFKVISLEIFMIFGSSCWLFVFYLGFFKVKFSVIVDEYGIVNGVVISTI
jgi:hypothetical protein